MYLMVAAIIISVFMALLFLSVPSMAKKPALLYMAIGILLAIIGWAILR
jgi:hypothetical protein